MTQVAHIVRTYRAPAVRGCGVHDIIKVMGHAQWFLFIGERAMVQTTQASVPFCTRCASVVSFQIGIPVPARAIPDDAWHSNVYVRAAGAEVLAT